jgi:hypothetical protein
VGKDKFLRSDKMIKEMVKEKLDFMRHDINHLRREVSSREDSLKCSKGQLETVIKQYNDLESEYKDYLRELK